MNKRNELSTGDALSELGEWTDVKGYLNCRISSNGAVMNKRTLKILKHFRYASTQEPCATLYRKGEGNILSVESLLSEHFPDASLPQVIYKKHKITEVVSADSFLDD